MPPAKILKALDLLQRRRDTEGGVITEMWSEFGAAIREARRDKNVGLKPFAKALGVSRSFVGFLESGKRQWSFEMAKRAVKILSNGHAK